MHWCQCWPQISSTRVMFSRHSRCGSTTDADQPMGIDPYESGWAPKLERASAAGEALGALHERGEQLQSLAHAADGFAAEAGTLAASGGTASVRLRLDCPTAVAAAGLGTHP